MRWALALLHPKISQMPIMPYAYLSPLLTSVTTACSGGDVLCRAEYTADIRVKNCAPVIRPRGNPKILDSSIFLSIGS